ncbi:MAG: hypothetical protein AAF517_18895, partial [Planctomycetota bacterium]
EFSSTPEDQIRAHLGIALSYRSLGEQLAGRLNDMESKQFQKQQRSSLRRARKLSLTQLEENKSAERFGSWLARIALLQHSARDEGEAPCRTGALALKEAMKNAKGLGEDLPPQLQLQSGALLLKAALEETEHLSELEKTEFQRDADAAFLLALLKYSRDDAKTKLLSLPAPDPEETNPENRPALAGDRRAYLINLSSLSRFLLESPQSGRLIEDSSDLNLSGRLADVRDTLPDDEKTVFSVAVGFAHLRAGKETEAKASFDEYIGLDESRKTQAALEIAEQCFRSRPTSKVCLEYLRKIESFGTPVTENLNRRLRLLIRASREAALETDAKKLLTQYIEKARNAEKDLVVGLTLTQAVRQLSGDLAARDELLRLRKVFRDKDALVAFEAEVLLSHAKSLYEDESTRASSFDFYAQSLGAYISLFVRNPMRSTALTRRCALLSQFLKTNKAAFSFETFAKRAVPTLDKADVDRLGRCLEAVFDNKHDAVVTIAQSISSKELSRFTCYLAGHSLIQQAARLEAAKGDADLVRNLAGRARNVLNKEKDYLPCRVELAGMDLGAVPAGTTVPSGLISRIEELSKADGIEHRGLWLRALAEVHDLNAEFRNQSASNYAVLQKIIAAQTALRAVIGRKSSFLPAYIFLAESAVYTSNKETRTGPAVGSTALPEPDFDRAVRILKSSPIPSRQSFTLISQFLGQGGRDQESLTYLMALALVDPSIQRTETVLGNLLENGRFVEARRILKDPAVPTPPLSTSATANLRELDEALDNESLKASPLHLDLVLRLVRKSIDDSTLLLALESALADRLEKDPLYQGERARLLGFSYAREYEATKRARRSTLLAGIIQNYQAAADYYSSKGAQPPLRVLNDLSWYLAESEDPNDWPRSLEYAKQCIKLVSLEAQPNVHDTYGWSLIRNEQFSEASALFEKLLAIRPEPTWRYHMAVALERQNLTDEAKAHLDQLADLDFAYALEVRSLRTKLSRKRLDDDE